MIVDQTSLPTHVHPFSGTRRPNLRVGPLLLECLDGHTPAERAPVDDGEPTDQPRRERTSHDEVRLGIDVACRADHRASLADERGEFIWSSWKFRTTTADLERLWVKIPAGSR